jgi:AcrR family transcriptional regulator
MRIPARILRATCAEITGGAPRLNPRQQLRQDRILAVGEAFMAECGPHRVTIQSLAAAVEIAPATLRRHFPDLGALFGEILRNHLRRIVQAVGEIPHDAPDRARQQRAAYFALTRTPRGECTPAHRLLVRFRHTLPDDELVTVEALRRTLGETLGGTLGDQALSLLDMLSLQPDRIESLFASNVAGQLRSAATTAQARTTASVIEGPWRRAAPPDAGQPTPAAGGDAGAIRPATGHPPPLKPVL